MPPKIDQTKCNGDGTCHEVCPADPKVFEIKDGKSHVVHPEACIECRACETQCPTGAISFPEEAAAPAEEAAPAEAPAESSEE